MPLSIKTKLQRLYLSWHIKVQQNQVISFYGKIMDCRQVQLYDGLKFLQNESHCKIGYIKNLNIHYKKRKNKVNLASG